MLLLVISNLNHSCLPRNEGKLSQLRSRVTAFEDPSELEAGPTEPQFTFRKSTRDSQVLLLTNSTSVRVKYEVIRGILHLKH